MKIYEAKVKLLKAINALETLKSNPQDHCHLKEEVIGILNEFTVERILKLKGGLRERRKKRLRQAKRRLEAKKDKEEWEAEKKRRNSEADSWLRQCWEIDETAKAEESVRRQADAVLHSVTRKKGDARRILALLPAISRLRAARSQQCAAQGRQPSEQATNAFEATMEKLRDMWEKQIEIYNTEEAALKVMLAEGSASSLGHVERDTDAMLHEWLMVMFGEGTIPEITWDDLVESRRSWDRFIVEGDVPLSSAIPSGWLLPQPLTRQDWKDAVIWF